MHKNNYVSYQSNNTVAIHVLAMLDLYQEIDIRTTDHCFVTIERDIEQIKNTYLGKKATIIAKYIDIYAPREVVFNKIYLQVDKYIDYGYDHEMDKLFVLGSRPLVQEEIEFFDKQNKKFKEAQNKKELEDYRRLHKIFGNKKLYNSR